MISSNINCSLKTTRSDYYPFGMLMRERSSSYEGYRFGFNGKESDDKVNGAGSQYDYGFRIFNTRIGKFLSVDPLFKSYPWYTPYQFAGNKPIWAIDLDGLEEYRVTIRTADDGNSIIKTISFVEPAKRTSRGVHGEGGVEYVYPNGRNLRRADFVQGSTEQFVANLPQDYSINQDMSNTKIGTRKEALGNYIEKDVMLRNVGMKEVVVAKFDNASSEVLNEGSQIDLIKEELDNYPVKGALAVGLVGHTDRDPMTPYVTKDDPDGNKRLSQERADQVKAELENCVTPDTEIKTSAAGSTQADRSKKNGDDRRVDAVIYRRNLEWNSDD